ncbi:MAG: PTS sugar transporter subunit IIA, partial [Microbacterium sp.]
ATAAETALQEDRGRIAATPARRLLAIGRMLLDAASGIDVDEVAEGFHVSDPTLEADLVRLRRQLAGHSLTLLRRGSRVELVGTEASRRAFLAWVLRQETASPGRELTVESIRDAFVPGSPGHLVFGSFRTALDEHLARNGYALNEMGAADTLLQLAIAADRSGRSAQIDLAAAEPPDPRAQEVAELLSVLAVRHLGVRFTSGEAARLAAVLLTRVIVDPEHIGHRALPEVDPEIEETVRSLLAEASDEFRVDLLHEELVRRLSLHIQVLRRRAKLGAWSQNSLTRSLKSSYPLIFDIAVTITAGLREHLDVAIPDDEIAYIAMHLGAFIEQGKWEEHRLTAVIVCPGYPETRDLLRVHVERALGNVLNVVDVRTSPDTSPSEPLPDLILSTSDTTETTVPVIPLQPFLTDADVDRIQTAVSRIRRSRRLSRLRGELERYFRPTAFLPDVTGLAPEQIIEGLGELLVRDGAVDDGYVQRVIERERLSSTAFIDAVAIPHAIGADSDRTSIAVGIAHPSTAWGDSRVQIVFLVAFSPSDRDAFQMVFEQLVE